MKPILRSLTAPLIVAGIVCVMPVHITLAKTVELPPAVAVLYFDYTGKDAQLPVLKKGLAQMLISDLQSTAENCIIVERDRLEEILQELKLGQSKQVDQKTAAKVGKLIGARYMVLGSFFDIFGQLRIDAKLVEVETGVILSSVGHMGKTDDFLSLEQAIAGGLAKALKAKAKPVILSETAAKKRPKRPKRRYAAKATKPPAKLKVKTATVLEYSKALDAKDRGDKATAIKHLKNVVATQPDFSLAVMDLSSLVQ
jgi:TolB-like protein